jgi:hypothetical protein
MMMTAWLFFQNSKPDLFANFAKKEWGYIFCLYTPEEQEHFSRFKP